jgi:hypothetical protein
LVASSAEAGGWVRRNPAGAASSATRVLEIMTLLISGG